MITKYSQTIYDSTLSNYLFTMNIDPASMTCNCKRPTIVTSQHYSIKDDQMQYGIRCMKCKKDVPHLDNLLGAINLWKTIVLLSS